MKVTHTHPTYTDEKERLRRLEEVKQNCRDSIAKNRKQLREAV